MLPPALPCVALEATADERAVEEGRGPSTGTQGGERSSRVVPGQSPESPSWKARAYVRVQVCVLTSFFCKLLRSGVGVGGILIFNFKDLLFSIKPEENHLLEHLLCILTVHHR